MLLLSLLIADTLRLRLKFRVIVLDYTALCMSESEAQFTYHTFFMCRSVDVCNLSTFSHTKVFNTPLFLERKKNLAVDRKEDAPVALHCLA